MDKHPEHDLRENDLQTFLSGLGDFWRRHGKSILLVTVVVLAGLLIWRMRALSAHERHENMWSRLSVETSPAGFAEVAREAEGAARYLALLNAGKLWVQDVVMPTPEDTAGEPVETPEAKLANAASALEQVANANDAPMAMRLDAMMGLAAVAENRRQWEEAAKWYDQVSAEAGKRYTTFAAQAQQRKALLARLAEPVTFSQRTVEPWETIPAAPAWAPMDDPVQDQDQVGEDDADDAAAAPEAPAPLPTE